MSYFGLELDVDPQDSARFDQIIIKHGPIFSFNDWNNNVTDYYFNVFFRKCLVGLLSVATVHLSWICKFNQQLFKSNKLQLQYIVALRHSYFQE